METLYTVARSDGDDREYNLTLTDAARAILHYDGGDYEIRPRPDGEGFDLWARQQVAGIGWRRTHWFSLEEDPDAAEADIFARVVADSGGDNWRGLIAEPQANYKASVARMLADLEDEEDSGDERDGLAHELAQMRD